MEWAVEAFAKIKLGGEQPGLFRLVEDSELLVYTP